MNIQQGKQWENVFIKAPLVILAYAGIQCLFQCFYYVLLSWYKSTKKSRLIKIAWNYLALQENNSPGCCRTACGAWLPMNYDSSCAISCGWRHARCHFERSEKSLTIFLRRQNLLTEMICDFSLRSKWQLSKRSRMDTATNELRFIPHHDNNLFRRP